MDLALDKKKNKAKPARHDLRAGTETSPTSHSGGRYFRAGNKLWLPVQTETKWFPCPALLAIAVTLAFIVTALWTSTT